MSRNRLETPRFSKSGQEVTPTQLLPQHFTFFPSP